MKILIIEDDTKTADFVSKGFQEVGMLTDVCHDGHAGLDRLLIYNYDAAVVDVMLPGIDGLSIIQAARDEGVHTPVLVLSARRSVSERIEGIRAGGDDYMVKPFSFSELVIRVQALVRRASRNSKASVSEDAQLLKVADLELHLWKMEARRAGQVIQLHQKEFSLLKYLMNNQGRVLSKTSILENVYDYDFDPQTNVVDVLIFRLRSKIDKQFDTKLIHTVRGMGYVLKEDE